MSRRELLTKGSRCLAGLAGFPLLAQVRDSTPLRITRVDPYILRIGRRANVFARVETAEGIHGWGEGTTPPSNPAVAVQIRESGKVVLGESAWDIEKLWRRMYITEENTLGGTLFAAMSAIDIALWDILGKKLGVPVYKLLGGKVFDKLRIYASSPWGNQTPRTREGYFTRTKEVMAQGATAGKFDPFGAYPGFDRQLSTVVLNEVREMLRGIREAGPNFDICIEAHGKFNVASAGRIVKMLEPFDPFFLEEPVPPENVDAMVAVQRSTNIPIATGEGLQSHFNYAALLEKQAARILQPDVARTGGITAMKKIVSMADAHYVTFAPHNPNGPVCCAASMHLAASSPNFLIMEQGNRDPKLYNEVFADGWNQTLAEWTIPETPGLGTDFSAAFVKENTVAA